jgi:hypothetical protein
MRSLFLLTLAAAASIALTANAEVFGKDELDKRTVQRRAVEAVIWGMPAVNYDLMLQEMLTKTPGKVNQVVYWGRPLDWTNQTLTPNPDTLYFMAFLNTKDVGPIVIEIPPADADGSLNANIVNIWQEPLEDAGKLGVDKGAETHFGLGFAELLFDRVQLHLQSGELVLGCHLLAGVADVFRDRSEALLNDVRQRVDLLLE